MHVDIEAMSGICGSISIACWVVVFSPQIIENFRRSSAEGLSVVFIVIWLAGDIFNIAGAVLQGLLPTMIILAVYYTLADIVLILQCFYYRGFTLKDSVPSAAQSSASNATLDEPTERSALLSHPTNPLSSPKPSNASTALGTSQSQNPVAQTTSRRSSFRDRLSSLDGTHLSPATPLHSKKRDNAALKGQSPVQKQGSLLKSVLFNLTAILVVCAAGVLGWWLSRRAPSHSHHDHSDADNESHWPLLDPTHGAIGRTHHHHHRGHEDGGTHGSDLQFNVLGQIFGYICMLLYLGSRVPQLLLNYRRKSTEGISMLFFVFACVGNLAYVLSILAYEPACYRAERQQSTVQIAHGGLMNLSGNAIAIAASCRPGEAVSVYLRNFLVNFSWLVGSFGTLLLDAAVFLQWYWYRESQGKGQRHDETEAGNNIAVDGTQDIPR